MDLERDGVAIIPGVFSRGEVNRIRQEAYLALSRISGGKNQLQPTPRGDSPGLLFWPSLSSDYLNAIRTDERLANIVRHYLGGEVRQINNQVYYRLPGDGDSFCWHQDQVFRKPAEDFPGIESGYLQTIIVVDEIREDNAPVEYIPGSHFRTFEGNPDQRSPKLREFERDGLEGLKLTAKPGDVVIWSVMVVHGSEPNESTSPRMTYMNGFAKAECAKYGPAYLSGGDVVPRVDVAAFK